MLKQLFCALKKRFVLNLCILLSTEETTDLFDDWLIGISEAWVGLIKLFCWF